MSILSKKSATRQVDFEMWLGISQSTISRAIEHIDCILVKVLPTANVIQQKIKDADATTLDQFVPDNKHMIDGTEFTMKRPHDNDVQKEYHSGKKEKTTYCKIDDRYKQTGLIIYAGSVYNDKKHDMAMLRLDDPDLGVITERMKSTQTADEDKPTSW